MPQDRALPSEPPAYVPDVSPVSGIPAQQSYFVGRYRIIDEIGLGGMASVHLARVDGVGGFQRWFAIKRIHPHLVEDESFVNMFLDEANIAARISHPNVATVFELGRDNDTYWIAMEYLHGEPLREVMRRTEELGQAMPPEIACRVIAEAADGLHAAHELQGKNGEKLNLIHRDVTPHNLFVTYEGVTKVVDFGIAKFQDRMASTQAGTLKGKLAYMSPEQVQGEAIDRRTDIFALGVVLWELTTGQRLFRMDSDLDTLAKVQECNIPPPSSMVRGYPLDLERILMQALAKNREERFQTAREFSRALQSLLTRRGLFIASDEVASYMASIFADRIAKREEHLRWASAVSDAAAAAGSAPPPAAAAPPPPRALISAPPPASLAPAQKGAPRPAAGAPAARVGNHGPASMLTSQQSPRPGASFAPRTSTLPPPPPLRGGVSYPLPASKAPPPPLDDDDDEDRTLKATNVQQVAVLTSEDDDDGATIVSRGGPSEQSSDVGAPPIPTPLPAAGAPPRAPNIAGSPSNAPAPTGAAIRPLPSPARTQMGLQAPRAGVPLVSSPPQAGISPLQAVPPGFQIGDPSLAPTTVSGLGGFPPTRPQQPWGGQPSASSYPPPPPLPGFAAPSGGSQLGPPFPGPFGGAPVAQTNPLPAGFRQNSGFGPQGFGPPHHGSAAPLIDPAFAATAIAPDMAAIAPAALIRPKQIPKWVVAVIAGVVALVLAAATAVGFALTKTTPPPGHGAGTHARGYGRTVFGSSYGFFGGSESALTRGRLARGQYPDPAAPSPRARGQGAERRDGASWGCSFASGPDAANAHSALGANAHSALGANAPRANALRPQPRQSGSTPDTDAHAALPAAGAKPGCGVRGARLPQRHMPTRVRPGRGRRAVARRLTHLQAPDCRGLPPHPAHQLEPARDQNY